MTHADASVSNGVLPISLSHVYNTNDRTANIGYGYGWRLNYAQSLKKVSVTNLSGTATYYQYIDGDGTRHYYKADGTSTTQYVNELDKDSVLTISGTTVTITDKGDNKLIFECDSSVANGRLTTIRDANGNETNIAYTTTTITNLRISSITEKLAGNDAGQALTLAYTNDLLSQVTAPNGLNVSYAYSDTNLTGITYADGETVSYTYNGNRCLTKATNIDAYSISYSYTAGAPYRVTRAAEAAGSTNGQYLTFTYGRNKTTVADAQGRRTVYHTDNIGQPVSVTDPEGRAVFATYNTASQTVTQLKAVSKMQMTVVNLLKNHGFEESTWPSSWTRSDSGNLTNDSSRRHTGAYSCKITAGSAARTLSQSVSVTSGQTYTLSAYFSGTLNTAYLKVTNGSSTIQSPAVTAGGTGWNRESLTFTAASSTITVAVIVPAGSGTVYVDSIQLEKGAAPNRYNMVMNSDFTSGTSNYTMNYANYCAIVDVADAKYAAARDTHPSFLDSKVYEMNGTSKAEKIKQTFLSGSTGDTYTFGAWIASNNIPQTKQQIYTSSGSTTTKDYGIKRLVLQFLNSSGTVVCSGYVNFAADTDEWQFASGTVTATSSYAQMQIVVEYTDSLNVLYVDGLQLHKEQFATGYSYDSNGNLSGTVSLIGQQNSFGYDSNDNLTSMTDARGNTTTYTYDSKHNLLTSTSPEGVVTSNTYNDFGLATETKVGTEADYIRTTTTYDSASGIAINETDASGNTVTDDAYSYTYDANNNILSVAQGSTASSYVYDAANQLVRANIYNSSTDSYTAIYAYDGNGNLTSKTLYPYTTDELGTATSTIQYGYATEGWSDQLTSYNGQSIVYDTSGNPTVYLGQSLSWNGLQLTGVGSNISYAYDKDGIRQTKTIDTATTQYYYNGNVLMGTYDGINKLLFSYDDQSNVVAVDYNGTYYYYLRDGQGSIVKLIDGNGSTVVSYSYDPWGVCTTTGSMASTLGALNPFRYHGYVYDEETGWYYLLSRYYNPTVGRYLSADTLSSTGQGVLGYNMYAYCLNNPTTNYDPSGSLSFSNIFSGASLLSIGLAAVAIGATILTCGAAAPIMVAVAAATTTTGIVTVANGIAEVQEGLTATNDTSNDGQNFMRDAFFRGDKAAYEKQRDVIATVAEVGTFLCTAYIGIKGGVCFVAGTAVLTAAGQVPIESISEGDLVYASDPETGESGYKRVVQTFVNETDELVHLQYGGTTVTTTPTHPFYQPQKGWIDAIDLRAGDILVKSNGEYVVVEAVEHELLEEPITVYNFEVEGFHTYYVGDTSVLVHNDCTKPRSPRKVGEDLIKRNDFDAHSFKRQNGARGPVAHWDIFQDTADKGRIWLGDKAQKVWIITKHHFSDLFKWF